MTGWRYLAYRLNGDGTETLIDPEVPIEDVQIEQVLSGDSSITGKIDPVYTRMLGPDGLPILNEWSTALYAEKDGEIRAAGILSGGSENGSSWELEFVGFTGYFRDMPYTGNGYSEIYVDPIDVARAIWDHPQSYPGGNIGLVYDETVSGLTIGRELNQIEFDTQEGPISYESGPYRLNWYSNHDLAGDIDDLAAATPFDYLEHHTWVGEDVLHRIEIGYPAIRRRRNDLRFVLGANIFEPPTIERDGSEFATGALVLGSGDGASMVHAIRETAPSLAGRLRRIAVVSDDKIRSVQTATARAKAEIQWRSRIEDITSVRVIDHKNAQLGAVRLGDEIYIEGKSDWREIGMWVRVLSISFAPADGGVAEYSVARTDRLTDSRPSLTELTD